MANVKLSRVDFRLIHGQVVTRWVAKCGTTDILIIDDRSAGSALQKKILNGAKPAGITLYIESVASAAEKWKAGEYEAAESLMLLFKDTATALSAYKAGVNYPSLQVGGVQGAGNKKNVYRNVVLSNEEAGQLKELGDAGVNVYFQPIPEDAEFPLSEALKKF